MEDNTPRVLVISHTVFSATGNMGKTMMRMLAGIPPDRLAQLYFHQEIPTRRCCLRYFELRTVRFCGLCLPDGRVDGLSTGMTLMKQPTAGWIAATG